MKILNPRNLIKRLIQSPLRRQLLVLLVVAQVLAHGTSILIVQLTLTSTGRIEALQVELTDALMASLHILGDSDDVFKRTAIESLSANDARFELTDTRPNELDFSAEITQVFQQSIPEDWRSKTGAYLLRNETKRPGPGGNPYAVVVELENLGYLWFQPRTRLIAESVPIVALTMSTLFIAVPLMILALWSGFYLIRPVERLSKGARRFADGAQPELLSVSGPAEIRAAIMSFNSMQHRLQTLMDTRSQTLASIGHDLRTPLTRLRLRLENVSLGDAEAGTQRDINAMESMIDVALEFLRNESHRVERVPVDIISLCETVTCDFADAGNNVTFRGTAKHTVTCDIDLTVRALSNIIDNAIKYAGGAEVSYNEAQGEIVVSDNGPGIAQNLLDHATEPFIRLETTPAKSKEAPESFGLGLSISKSAMLQQGGRLRFSQNKPTGLIVRLVLPR